MDKNEEIKQQVNNYAEKMRNFLNTCEKQIVTVTGADGKIRLSITCNGELTELHLDPTILELQDIDLIQSLILQTINHALQKVADIRNEMLLKLEQESSCSSLVVNIFNLVGKFSM